MSKKWVSRYQLKPDRWVFVQHEDSARIGRKIKKSIEGKWTPPRFYYHLISGGHLAALKSHINNRSFSRLDISDFFGSINRSRVTRSLKKMYGYQDARFMASESVVKIPEKNIFALPYGFVQSPILASLAFSQSHLGIYLSEIEAKKEITVSVYVDDIIISSMDEDLLLETYQAVLTKATFSKFPLNYSKLSPPSPCVTAFNINLSTHKMEITESRLLDFKKAYISSYGTKRSDAILRYVYSVNEKQGNETYNY